MGIIDPYVAEFHESVKPHILGAAREARMYGRSICDRLEHIHRELAIDRDPGEIMALNIVLPAAAAAVHIIEVPTGEEWVLEVFQIDCMPATQQGARLFSDGNFRMFQYMPWNGTARISPVRFKGPCSITADAFNSASAFNAYIQFRRLAPRARPTQSAGRVETGLDAVSALREHDPLHSGIGIG